MQFQSAFKQAPSVPQGTKVVFVSDMFAEDYTGGAELTTQALIDSCDMPYYKLHSKDVDTRLLEQGHGAHWIFGNFAGMNPNLIPTIVANMKYSVLEYDYKYCRFRSPEKHQNIQGTPCDCHNQLNGKLISAFFQGAQRLWWMSEAQKERYHTFFPFLAEKDNIVVSSVFSRETLGKIRLLRQQVESEGVERRGWLVLGSESWIKGTQAAEAWCVDNGKDYEVVSGVPYDEMLGRLSGAEGLVYLPLGGDTCPRLVIEAKLLGCKLRTNDNVQHAREPWFDTDDLESIHEYLWAATDLFWRVTRHSIDYVPRVSGYTTTYDCVLGEYPFRQCVESMLGFCDEVCVVDGGSTDGTWEALQDMSSREPRLKLKQSPKDRSHPRFAPQIDGLLKAEARQMCTGDLCWQMDSDEVVDSRDYQKVRDLASKVGKGVDIVSLPVIEYWGGPDKVRLDVTPWKWRLSRNDSNITHGIPAELRRYDSGGNLYAAHGTDSCDMIYADSGERVPHVTFVTQESEATRQAALQGNQEALGQYESWFNSVVDNLPSVHHYSWYNMPRKVRQYRDYWSKFWSSMYGEDKPDTADNNVMFDVPWSQVTEEMIQERAKEFCDKLGGWVWHQKWDGKTTTPSLRVRSPRSI